MKEADRVHSDGTIPIRGQQHTPANQQRGRHQEQRQQLHWSQDEVDSAVIPLIPGSIHVS